MSSVFPYKSAIVVTCFPQQSPWLAKEMEALDYEVQSSSITEVEISGYMDDCLRLNMYLRTANRVLFQIQRFRAVNANELYKKIKDIPWEKYLDNDGYISITSYVKNDTITDDEMDMFVESILVAVLYGFDITELDLEGLEVIVEFLNAEEIQIEYSGFGIVHSADQYKERLLDEVPSVLLDSAMKRKFLSVDLLKNL